MSCISELYRPPIHANAIKYNIEYVMIIIDSVIGVRLRKNNEQKQNTHSQPNIQLKNNLELSECRLLKNQNKFLLISLIKLSITLITYFVCPPIEIAVNFRF